LEIPESALLALGVGLASLLIGLIAFISRPLSESVSKLSREVENLDAKVSRVELDALLNTQASFFEREHSELVSPNQIKVQRIKLVRSAASSVKIVSFSMRSYIDEIFDDLKTLLKKGRIVQVLILDKEYLELPDLAKSERDALIEQDDDFLEKNKYSPSIVRHGSLDELVSMYQERVQYTIDRVSELREFGKISLALYSDEPIVRCVLVDGKEAIMTYYPLSRPGILSETCEIHEMSRVIVFEKLFSLMWVSAKKVF
jgi:hypothetical protein